MAADIFDPYLMDFLPVRRKMEDYHLCVDCHIRRVKSEGELCSLCADDRKKGYRTLTLAGRCRNGAERDHGTRWHAVPIGGYKALCGAEPGRRSVGWSSGRIEDQGVTCPRCKKRLSAIEQTKEG
jgi:hypothetical protein